MKRLLGYGTIAIMALGVIYGLKFIKDQCRYVLGYRTGFQDAESNKIFDTCNNTCEAYLLGYLDGYFDVVE